MEPISVLIVEDDPVVVEVNQKFTEDIPGFKVVDIARTGEEALELIDKHKPVLTLLDIYLPDTHGVAVLREIRRRNLPTNVILITAAQDVEIIQEVLRYGAVDYIIKPFKFNRFKMALSRFATLYTHLKSISLVEQEDIDRLLFTEEESNEKSNINGAPKGISEITLKQVFLYLSKQEEALSAEEVGWGLGMARVTARRYLEYLENNGMAKLELQYGSVGRPVKKYKICSNL